jgi:DNA ligase-1
MLVACSGTEAKFLVRGLQGKLRIGLAEKTVVVSLAHAVTLTTASTLDTRSGRSAGDVTAELESAEATLRQVLCEMPCFDEVVPALLRGGVAEARSACKLTPGTCRAVPCRTVPGACRARPCHAVPCGVAWRGVVWRALRHGMTIVRMVTFTGIPVGPMLAKPTNGVSEVLDRLQGLAFTCEWKYDGERGQVCCCWCRACASCLNFVMVSL